MKNRKKINEKRDKVIIDSYTAGSRNFNLQTEKFRETETNYLNSIIFTIESSENSFKIAVLKNINGEEEIIRSLPDFTFREFNLPSTQSEVSVQETSDKLSEYSEKSLGLQQFKEYIKMKLLHDELLCPIYQDPLFRRHTLNKYINKQKCEAAWVNQLKTKLRAHAQNIEGNTKCDVKVKDPNAFERFKRKKKRLKNDL
ncbi:hypothetical protein P9112_004429 [Eukaryota sp. TZLM1-RC]